MTSQDQPQRLTAAEIVAAHTDGYDACARGARFTACPHRADPARRAWIAGFAAARTDLAAARRTNG